MKGLLLLTAFIFLSHCGILFLNPKEGNKNEWMNYIPFLGINSNTTEANVANDTIAPTVLTAIPAVSSTNIPINQKITITFTEPVVAIASPITLIDPSSNPVTGTATWNNAVLEYTLNSNLAYNTKYTVTLSSEIKDEAGIKIPSSFSYQFTTEQTGDNTSPTVIGTTPVSGTASYNINSSLNIVFSEPILISSFNSTNVTVTNDGNPVLIAVNANSSNGTIVPVGGWAYSSNYLVTIKKEIQDITGNPMIADYTFTFSTEPDTDAPQIVSQIPEVYTVTPPSGLTVPGHSINDPIQIVFDKELFPASVNSSSFLVSHGGSTISGTISVSPTTTSATEAIKNYKIKFTPNSRLPHTNGTATPITVTLTTAIQDTAGNTLAAPYTFTFHTKYTEIYASTVHNCVLLPSGKVRCWGTNLQGQLGNGNFDSVPSMDTAKDLRLGEPALKIDTGLAHSCALLLSGGIKCWGNGFSGALGTGGRTTISDPNYIPTLYIEEKITSISVSMNISCITTESGKYKCWGSNDDAALGYGYKSSGEIDFDSRLSISESESLSFPGKPVKQIAAGSSSNCGLTTTGDIKCWGSNAVGELGLPSAANLLYPDSEGMSFLNLNLGGAIPVQMASKHLHTCIALNNGEGLCWGIGNFGTNGTTNGTRVYDASLIPKLSALPFKSITKVLAANINSCAIFTEGTMTCWGINSFLGIGFPSNYISFPLPNPDQENSFTNSVALHLISFLPTKIVDASIGYSHGCLIIDTDEIRCWGTGVNYVLGDGSNTTIASATGNTIPINIPALPFYSFKRTDY
ncbi:MAG: Ig-like domain-containing protein [Leptospiraceae bacterium]|nr:Ig-like domain-containing protein [Leptospiraceae bacterium]